MNYTGKMATSFSGNKKSPPKAGDFYKMGIQFPYKLRGTGSRKL